MISKIKGFSNSRDPSSASFPFPAVLTGKAWRCDEGSAALFATLFNADVWSNGEGSKCPRLELDFCFWVPALSCLNRPQIPSNSKIQLDISQSVLTTTVERKSVEHATWRRGVGLSVFQKNNSNPQAADKGVASCLIANSTVRTTHG